MVGMKAHDTTDELGTSPAQEETKATPSQTSASEDVCGDDTDPFSVDQSDAARYSISPISALFVLQRQRFHQF